MANNKKEKNQNIDEEIHKENIIDSSLEVQKNNRNTLKNVWNIVFWTSFIIVMLVWLFDFIRVANEQEPLFCIKEKIHKFEDGTVTECTGIGYKIYKYNRTSLESGIEFGPFFMEMKDNEE